MSSLDVTLRNNRLELLKSLQKIPVFKDLRLVGGTGLALQSGHRKSIDLDLFGNLEADDIEIADAIATVGQFKILQKSRNITIYLIKGIKTDIVRYKYEWLQDALIFDELRIAGKKDIAAMKLAAITGRGTKKDFIDLAFLLREFTVDQMIDFYSQKYPEGEPFLVIKSLGYFADADNDPMPVMLNNTSWDQIKRIISDNLNSYFS